jgi:hypothetical protein
MNVVENSYATKRKKCYMKILVFVFFSEIFNGCRQRRDYLALGNLLSGNFRLLELYISK